MKYTGIYLAVAAAISAFGNTDAQKLTLEECSLDARPSVPNEMVSDASGDTYYMLSDDGSRVERYDTRRGKKLLMSWCRRISVTAMLKVGTDS